jgi:integrase
MERPYSDAVLLLVETGMRFGELAGLHWQRVDLRRKQLDVIESWSRAGNCMKPYPKSRKRRSVPLSDRALEILESLPRLLGQCGQRHEGTVRCTSTLVLPSPEGLPLDSHNMRERHWMPALKLAGLEHARQHDLRHTYASWLAQAGVPLGDIAEALGHSDAYVTQRYKHLADRHLDRVREALNQVRDERKPIGVSSLRVIRSSVQ